MNDAPDRFPVKLLGRILGTSTGWDGDEEWVVFYNFKPNPGVSLPSECDLTFKVTEGLIGVSHPATGDLVDEKDIFEALKDVPRD